jgi:Tfp pilus assembly protein PilV
MDPANRAGFTLVELLVSILLIDVALLSMVAAGAILVRSQNDLRARLAADRAASNRLETLLSSGCQPTSGNSRGERGITEYWQLAIVEGRREIVDSVTYSMNGLPRSTVARARSSC